MNERKDGIKIKVQESKVQEMRSSKEINGTTGKPN
jgi:hypothetical protein